MISTWTGLGLNPRTAVGDARRPKRLLRYSPAGIPSSCAYLEGVRRKDFPNVVLVPDEADSLAADIRQTLTLLDGRAAQIDAYDLHLLVTQYDEVQGDALHTG